MFNGLLVSLRKVRKYVSVYLPPFSGLKLCDLNIFVQRLFGCLLDSVYICVFKFKEVTKLVFAVSYMADNGHFYMNHLYCLRINFELFCHVLK